MVAAVSALYLGLSLFLDYQLGGRAGESVFHETGLSGWMIKERSVELLLFWWIVAFGACVGSFLNVVVYRMPLGMSLSAKSSHCVWCKTPIWSRDNLPIIGWLMLRGRCRKCRLPISGRYPLVEALTALLGLVLFLGTVQVRGWGLASLQGEPVKWHFWLMNPAPVAALVWYFYLFWLMSVMMSAAWMDYDRKRLPLRLVMTTGIAALVIPLGVNQLLEPYLTSVLRFPITIPFVSQPWRICVLQWLPFFDNLSGLAPTASWNDALSVVVLQVLGMLVGVLVGLGLWLFSLIAFRQSDLGLAESSEIEEEKPQPSSSQVGAWWESAALFGVTGLFGGVTLTLTMGVVYFLTLVLLTPLLMNTRLSPLRLRWFFIPYVCVIAILLWRIAEAGLLPRA